MDEQQVLMPDPRLERRHMRQLRRHRKRTTGEIVARAIAAAFVVAALSVGLCINANLDVLAVKAQL